MPSESLALNCGFYPAAELNVFIGPLYFAGAFICEDYLADFDKLPEDFFGLEMKELNTLVEFIASKYLLQKKAFVVVESISTYQLEKWSPWTAVSKRYRSLANKTKSLAATELDREDILYCPHSLFTPTVGSDSSITPAVKLAMLFAHYARARKLIYYSQLYKRLPLSTGRNDIGVFARSLKDFESLPPFVISSQVVKHYVRHIEGRPPKWLKQLIKETTYESKPGRSDARGKELPQPRESARIQWRITPHVDYY